MTNLIDSDNPALYEIQTNAAGPAGSLPLTPEMLRHMAYLSVPKAERLVGSRIQVQDYQKKRLGMTLAEVESLLGAKPGYYVRLGWTESENERALCEGAISVGGGAEYQLSGHFTSYNTVSDGMGSTLEQHEGRFCYTETCGLEILLDEANLVIDKRLTEIRGEWDLQNGIKRWYHGQ